MAKLTMRTNSPATPAISSPTPATPAADVSTPASATPPIATFRRRRAILAFAAFAVVGLWLYHVNQPATTAPQALSALDQTATTLPASPTTLIQGVLSQALSYQQVHGSFTGFAPAEPAGVLVGADGPGMVVSASSGTTCLYSGILPSGQKPVLSDPSGQACTPALVAAAKATLAAEATASARDAQATLAATAAQVQSAMVTFAAAGHGSYALVPSSLGIAGTTVLSHSPSQVAVKVSSGSACEILTIHTSQQVPGIAGC